MKHLVGFSRVFVGVLFIISGFIKLNDPVGFSFKLEEYFSQGVLDLPFLMPYALAISIFVVIFEVVLGVFLLIGYRKSFTIWSLLIMILFFTFLTFYSAYFNKVTDCGCFGDAIKLTPWESFTKDIILLVLILILYFGSQYIKPLFSQKVQQIIALVAVVICILFGNHVLNHLPVFDFRAYKVGANIEDGMRFPEDAPKPIYEYSWKFKNNGKELVVVTNGEYPDVDGEFIDVETKEIQKGYEPPIHDFTIEQEGEDFTPLLMQEAKLLMVVTYDLSKSEYVAFEKVKAIADRAVNQGYKVIGMSASNSEWTNRIIQEYQLGFEFYFTDETTLKTIVRSNPGILTLKNGTITQKVHYNDIEDLIIE
ncbi:BT_3928 family protein [uncultured Eudoraea sp.]|uniref:BT_3928 family protein n=1 Tax=uncultured Eudoraea sp. TaxID=1035614 RepID=UPI0026316636|nr:BT_3928 family protein [uncultured Eudoraea sp.]